MSVLHGEITKVHEVLAKGYEEPIVQTTHAYSINTGAIGAGNHIYALTNITAGKTGYPKKISVSCNDSTAIHHVYLSRLPGNVAFFTSWFYRGDEWTLGDVGVLSPPTTWIVTILNNAAGATFTINVYWIEV